MRVALRPGAGPHVPPRRVGRGRGHAGLRAGSDLAGDSGRSASLPCAGSGPHDATLPSPRRMDLVQETSVGARPPPADPADAPDAPAPDADARHHAHEVEERPLLAAQRPA